MTVQNMKGTDPEHLLLATAKTYPVLPLDLTPPGCHYDLVEGAWIFDDLGSLLADTPGRPMPATKKADNETRRRSKRSMTPPCMNKLELTTRIVPRV